VVGAVVGAGAAAGEQPATIRLRIITADTNSMITFVFNFFYLLIFVTKLVFIV
jgi:hypothetical protein